MSQPAVDTEVLEGLRALGGDEEDILSPLVEEFLDLTRASCDDIAAAVGALDADALARAAHKLKGGAASMGANPLAEVGRRLEELGRGGSLEGAASLLDALAAECVRVRDALAPYRA